MIKSMTGFGKTEIIIPDRVIVIEIKTLNSKQLDLNCRLASLFREKENEIRQLLTKELMRGKIDISIYFDKSSKIKPLEINKEIAKQYFTTLQELSEYVGNNQETDIFSHLLSIPEIMSSAPEELSDELRQQIFPAIKETCDKVNECRKIEGEVLADDFIKRINKIESLLCDIEPYEENRIINQKKKFIESLEKNLKQTEYDLNRLEQELIYFLEKLDITEEKVRLRKHCRYFIETLNNESLNGKKLGFIVQECNREINTIGSKCNDFEIQRIVVNMKDEVEKLKEQLANIL